MSPKNVIAILALAITFLFYTIGQSGSVNQYTGQHEATFSLASVSGAGGLTANVTIGYNGNVSRIARSPNCYAQVSPVGLGFGMGEQSVISNPNGTSILEDDEYFLSFAGSMSLLKQLDANTFITTGGNPWKIYRQVDETITDVPIIIGWTVITEDGMYYRFGDFNDTSLTYFNATRNIHRYGEYVGAGATDDGEPYPIQWDLRLAHDPDTINWMEITYMQESDIIVVMDKDGDLTNSSTYTRASYVDEISLSDGSKIDISYSDRLDYQKMFNVNLYEYYSTKKVDKVETIGRNDSVLAVTKLDYTYLNHSMDSSYKKLLLTNIVSCSGDESDTLSTTGFIYYTDTSDVSFGSIRKIIGPSGSIEEYHYDNISSSQNMSTLNAQLYEYRYNIDGKSDIYMVSDMVYAEQNERADIGVWDGVWHIDSSTGLTGNELLDLPALSPDGWMAYYDRSLDSLVVRQWMGGYWKIEKLQDEIDFPTIDSAFVNLYAGRKCFIVCTGGYEDFGGEDKAVIKKIYYYHYDGENWDGSEVASTTGTMHFLGNVQVADGFYAVALHDDGYEPDTKIYYGLHDYVSDEVMNDTVRYADWSAYDSSQFAIGSSFLGVVHDDTTSLYRWYNSQWDTLKYSEENSIPVAICSHANGITWMDWDNAIARINTLHFTEDSPFIVVDTMQGIFPFPYKVTQSSHSLEVYYGQYDGIYPYYALLEWNGTEWDSVEFCNMPHFDAFGTDTATSSLLEPSYSNSWIDDDLEHFLTRTRRYIGLQEWGDVDTLFSSIMPPGIEDNFFVYMDTFQTTNKIRMVHYDDFRYANGYKEYIVDEQTYTTDSIQEVRAVPGGFFVKQSAAEFLHADAYALVDNHFKGEYPLVVVDKVYNYRHLADVDTIIQNYKYYAGTVTGGGDSPCFAKAEASLPYYAGDSPDGYQVTYFYNDLSDTTISDGHIAQSVTIPNLDSMFVNGSDTTLIYGIRNGGYWLNGMPYLTYAYTVDSGTSEIVDYAYNYYSLSKTPDSAMFSEIYRVQLDSVKSRSSGLNSKIWNIYDKYSGLLVESKNEYMGGDSLISQITYAFQDTLNTARADSIKADNALVQVLENASYHYRQAQSDSVLLSKARTEYNKKSNWLPVSTYTWRDIETQQDTLFTYRMGDINDKGLIYGIVGIDGDTAWIKYDKDTLRAVAAASKCSYGDFLVQDFEQGSNENGWDGWNTETNLYVLDESVVVFTGEYSKKLIDDPSSSDHNWGSKRTIPKDSLSDSLYYFSCWVRSNYPVRFWCICKDNLGQPMTGGELYHEFNDLESQSWQKVSGVFDLTTINWTVLDSITIQFSMNNDAGDTATSYFDNFRFHPLKARVSTQVFNTYDMVTATLGINNVPSRIGYDDLFRVETIKNYCNDTLNRNEYSYTTSLNLNHTVEASLTNPDVGLDTAYIILDYNQFVACSLSISASGADYASYAWIYQKNDGGTNLIDSIHCANVCAGEISTAGFWGKANDTIIVFVTKTSGEGQGAAWSIYAGITADEYNYDPADPPYTKSIAYADGVDTVVSISFYDSYGRLLQNRKTNYLIDGGDTTEAALVGGFAEFDARGRVLKSYKPYVDILNATGIDDFTPIDSIYIEDTAFYCDTCNISCYGRPLSQRAYYGDVRGLLHKVCGPGDPTIWAYHMPSYTYVYDTVSQTVKTIQSDADGNESATVSDRWGSYTRSASYYNLNGSTGTDSVITLTYMNVKGQIDSVVYGDGVDYDTIRTCEYDDLGRLIREWRVDYGNIKIKYDKAGRLRFMQNNKRAAEGNFVYFKYDTYGRKIEEGLCDTLINDSSAFTQGFADLSDFPGDNLVDSSKTVTYRWKYDYDFARDSSINFGALVRTENSDSTYYKEFHYFPFDYKDSTVIQLLIENSDKKSLVHEYDKLTGAIDKFRFYPYEDTSGARAQLYLYDKSWRLQSIRECDLDSNYDYNRDYATYGYFGGGLINSVSLGRYLHGDTDHTVQTMDYSYNIQGLLTAINDTSNVVSTLSGNDCHFGENIKYWDGAWGGYHDGRISGISSAHSANSSTQQFTYKYYYNQLGWLKKADCTNLLADSLDREYLYNYLGNRTALTGFSLQDLDSLYYYYDNAPASSKLDRIDSVRYFPMPDTSSTVTLENFTFDILGNLTEIPERPIDTQTYDYRNLLAFSRLNRTYPNATPNNLDFAYDQTGNRIRKRFHYYWRIQDPGGGIEGLEGEGGGGGEEWIYKEAHTEWHYLYDNGVLVGIFDGNDNASQAYINGPGGQIGVYRGNNDTERYYFLKDHLGSNRVVVDDSGDVVEYTDYYPFGSVMSSFVIYDEPLEFTGKERDDHLSFEFDYFGARYYDSKIGTFSSIDKAAEFAGGFNYCGNNPISCIDPNGLRHAYLMNPAWKNLYGYKGPSNNDDGFNALSWLMGKRDGSSPPGPGGGPNKWNTAPPIPVWNGPPLYDVPPTDHGPIYNLDGQWYPSLFDEPFGPEDVPHGITDIRRGDVVRQPPGPVGPVDDYYDPYWWGLHDLTRGPSLGPSRGDVEWVLHLGPPRKYHLEVNYSHMHQPGPDKFTNTLASPGQIDPWTYYNKRLERQRFRYRSFSNARPNFGMRPGPIATRNRIANLLRRADLAFTTVGGLCYVGSIAFAAGQQYEVAAGLGSAGTKFMLTAQACNLLQMTIAGDEPSATECVILGTQLFVSGTAGMYGKIIGGMAKTVQNSSDYKILETTVYLGGLGINATLGLLPSWSSRNNFQMTPVPNAYPCGCPMIY